MACLRFFLCLLTMLLAAPGASAQWMAEIRVGRVVHLVNASAQVVRYDLEAGQYLPQVQLPGNHGTLAAAAVDADGIYAAYGNSVYRYALDGTDERHVTDVGNTISSIFTDGDLLLIVHPVQDYARVTSVRKITHAFIDFHEVYPAGGTGACISRGHNRIIGSSVGLSPANLTSISYGDDGVFTGDDRGSPPHPQLAGSRTWVDEEQGRVIDNNGNVFDLQTMECIGNLEREPESMTSGPAGLAVGSKGALTLYDADLKALGDVNGSASMLVMDGSDVLVPRESGPWTRYPLADFSGVPVPAVDPAKLAYTIDDAFASASGMVHLFSKAHSSLFLWDPETLAYAGVIPLRKEVMAVTYSASTDTIYTGYPGGLVRRIQLADPDREEVVFAQLIGGAGSISTAGDLLFASSRANSTYSQNYVHYVFAADGTKISRRAYQFPVSMLAWSPGNQRMYYQSREGYDTKLGWFAINGTTEFPGCRTHLETAGYYDPAAQAVRPSPSGSIVASTPSYLRDGTTLSTLSGHQYTQGRFKDAAWTDGGFYSIHHDYDVGSTQNVTLVLRSDGTSLASLGGRRIHGLPSLIRPLSGGRLLLVTVPVGGVPSLRVLDADLEVAHGGTLAPPPVISAESFGYYNRLKWGDVPAAASFAVQRRELPDGPWTTIGTGISGYDDTNQIYGRIYEYRLRAANGALLSEPAYFNQPSLGRPDKPVLAGTFTSTTTGTLSWQGNETHQYELQYAFYTDRPDARWKWNPQPQAGSGGMDVAGLTPCTQIYFYLRATNAFGASDWSEPFAILTPPVPAHLHIPAVEADGVSVRWDEPYNTITPRTYLLERMTGEDGPWQPLGEIGPYHTDRDVENGLTYRYRIITANASGEAISNTVEVLIPPRPLPELGFGELSARHGPGPSIILRWWFGRYERGYRIERRTEGSAWSAISEVPPITNLYYVEHEDPAVVPDTVYWYRVVYFNETGETPTAEVRCRAAETATLVTEDFEPDIDGTVWEDTSDGEWVQDTTAPGNHVLRLSAKESAAVTLKPLDTSAGGWIRFRCRGTAAPGMEEGANQPYLWVHGTDSDGFSVYAGEIRPTELHSLEWRTYQFELPESSTSPASAISFDANWTASGHWEIDDIEISAAIPRTAPQAVDTASLSSWHGNWSPPDVRWKVAADANGYVIERRTADSPWTVVGIQYMESGLLFGGPQFNDYSARPSTTYFYRVIARNAAGDSPPSGELAYTTISATEQWQRIHYGQDWNAPMAAWLEDNGTGTVNLLKYAFNLPVYPWTWRDPADPSGLPELASDPETGLLRIRFIRCKEDWLPGVRYVVEFSDDATTWTPAGRLVEREPSFGKYERVTWQDDPPEAGEVRTKRFCRVHVTQE